MDFNLEYCRAFLYAARYNSFSKAAEALFLTQPAISQSVHQLEKQLNCKLFTRTSHGMMLTPEGKLLFDHVEKAYDLLEAGWTKLARFSSTENSDLYIGATETALYFHVLPKLKEFNQLYPHINVHIRGSHSPELMQMLKDGAIDVAFGVSPIREDFSLSVSYLTEFQDVFIAGKGFSYLADQVLEPKDLLALPMVLPSLSSSFSDNITQWFNQQQLKINPKFHVLTTSYVLPFLQNDLAIGCVPDFFAQQWTKNEDIFVLQLTKMPLKRYIFLATNDNLPLSVASQKFIHIMRG